MYLFDLCLIHWTNDELIFEDFAEQMRLIRHLSLLSLRKQAVWFRSIIYTTSLLKLFYDVGDVSTLNCSHVEFECKTASGFSTISLRLVIMFDGRDALLLREVVRHFSQLAFHCCFIKLYVSRSNF